MQLLTLNELKSNPHSHYHDYHNSQQQQFQLAVKQLLLGLPVEPMIASCPQIFNWVQQIQALLPKLFLLPSSKLEIDSLYSQKLDVGATSVCIQITTNTVYKLRRTVLIEWAIRQAKINWHERVKLWTACEYLSIPPESLSLIFLAVQPNSSAKKLVIKWNQQQHQETRQWLINLLEKEPNGDRSNHSGTRLLPEYTLALDDIDEVAI